MDGFPGKTIIEHLSAIPVPRVEDTGPGWNQAIVAALRPYFILPKKDPSAFVEWMLENLGIRELTREDLFPGLYNSLNGMRKGMSDRFWLLDREEKNRMFFESCWGTGPDVDVMDVDFYVLIGYHPEWDVFYSSCNFLNNTLIYFRGMDPADLQRESTEVYPPTTALGYAAHLESALYSFSTSRADKTSRND